jgi:DNA-binding MarR family transcriptional regulator
VLDAYLSFSGALAKGLLPTRVQEQIALVAALASTPPTVSDAMRVLRAKGLVERGAGPADARAVVVLLTAEGRAEADRLSAVSAPLHEAVTAMCRTRTPFLRRPGRFCGPSCHPLASRS